MFAVTLNFGFTHIVGMGAMVTAILFLTCQIARRVGVVMLMLSIHGSTSMEVDARQGPLSQSGTLAGDNDLVMRNSLLSVARYWE